MAAIANLPIDWMFEDPRRHRGQLILRATGPDGDEILGLGRVDRRSRAGAGRAR